MARQTGSRRQRRLGGGLIALIVGALLLLAAWAAGTLAAAIVHGDWPLIVGSILFLALLLWVAVKVFKFATSRSSQGITRDP